MQRVLCIVRLARAAQHLRVEAVAQNRHPKRHHVQPQLVALAGDGAQVVQRVGAQRLGALDVRFAVWLAGHFAREEKALGIRRQAASVGVRQHETMPMRRHGLIQLVHAPIPKQRLIGIARVRLHGKNNQPGRLAVDAVHRAQIGQAQPALEPHQQALLHKAAARRDRHEVRLVGHHQPLVLKRDVLADQRFGLGRQAPVVEDALAGAAGRAGVQRLALRIENFAARQTLGPFIAAQHR